MQIHFTSFLDSGENEIAALEAFLTLLDNIVSSPIGVESMKIDIDAHYVPRESLKVAQEIGKRYKMEISQDEKEKIAGGNAASLLAIGV